LPLNALPRGTGDAASGKEQPIAGPKFASRFGFIMAATGSAVGLGNIWRFPFVAGENGGGAFLLPYVMAVVLLGLPVMIIEIRAGSGTGRGVVGAFQAASKRAAPFGLLIAGASLLLLSYYLVVTGWAIGYLVHGVADQRPGFDTFTSGANSVWFFLAAVALTTGIVVLGVNKGIELSSLFLMPALVVILLGLAVYGMTLPGRGEALRFFLAPDFAALSDPAVWIRAFGQAFFSVGVGMGVLITYGSYLPRGTDVTKSSIVVAAADTSIAILAGLVVFPLAFSFGSSPGAGPGLAFDTLPQAFDSFGAPTGYFVGVLFYAALSVAAITSAVSLLETAVVSIGDAFRLRRAIGLGLVITALLLLGLPSALSYSGNGLQVLGRPFLDLADTLVGTLWLPIGVLVTVIVLGWLYRRDGGESSDTSRLNRLIAWSVQWLVPSAIVAVLGAMLLDLLRHRIVPHGG